MKEMGEEWGLRVVKLHQINGQNKLYFSNDQRLEGGRGIRCGLQCFPWISVIQNPDFIYEDLLREAVCFSVSMLKEKEK